MGALVPEVFAVVVRDTAGPTLRLYSSYALAERAVAGFWRDGIESELHVLTIESSRRLVSWGDVEEMVP